jgi:hypothetical protein
MSDVNGAAPAAADSPSMPADVGGAPIGEGANFTQPLGSQIPPEAQAQVNEPKKPPTLDDSIDRAIAKSEAKAKEPAKVESKPELKEAKAEQPRDNGKFVAKDAIASESTDVKVTAVAPKPAGGLSPAAEEAPKWIRPHEKAAWSTMAPEQKAIAERRDKEAIEGVEKYRPAAERYEPYRELDDIAKHSGKEGHAVFREYYNMEQLLQKDLVGGLDNICQRMGVSFKDVAAHVMGQTPDEQASRSDATIRELKQELAALKEQVGGVTQTFQKQQQTATAKEVEAFAAQHPRFDELADDIAFFLKNRTNDLSEAYTLAERLNPAPAETSNLPVASTTPVADLSIQPDKGQKSINGAPSSGASPAGKKRVARSLDEALDHAFGQAG